MFAHRYFPARMFAPRYFPVGSDAETPAPGPLARITDLRRVVVRDRRTTQITAVATYRLQTRRP